jgi:membrane protein
VFTVLFAAAFRLLPDARVGWYDTWVGSTVTAFLFALGKWAIGLYLAERGLGSTYGAAGSMVVLLVWVYYSCTLLFLGAEFTQAWAQWNGRAFVPTRYAERIDRDASESVRSPQSLSGGSS